MKNQKQTKKFDANFASTLESETHLTPHTLYTSLAIDAALLYFNDKLPVMTDEENERLLHAAHIAAETALTLAQVPNGWLEFVASLHYESEEKVRAEMWDVIFDLLGEDHQHLADDKTKAEKKIISLAKPDKAEAMRRALNDFDHTYMSQVLESIYTSFALGYRLAADPTPLLFEKGRG